MVFTNVGSWTCYYKENFSAVVKKLDRAGIEKDPELAAKGLALINSTTVLTGIGALATYDVNCSSSLISLVLSQWKF